MIHWLHSWHVVAAVHQWRAFDEAPLGTTHCHVPHEAILEVASDSL